MTKTFNLADCKQALEALKELYGTDSKNTAEKPDDRAPTSDGIDQVGKVEKDSVGTHPERRQEKRRRRF